MHMKIGKKTWLFLGILLSIYCILSVLKARIGFDYMDGPFYITIPRRMSNSSDLYIVDEYHFSQLSALLLQPIYSLYILLTHNYSGNGIILDFRYIYIVIHAAIGILIFTRLLKYGWKIALLTVVFFISYVPYNIMSLSYNTMGIDCLALCCVIALTNDNNSKILSILSGMLYAAAVLCCPYLIIIYFALLARIIILTIKKRDNIVNERQNFFFLSIGCFLVGIATICKLAFGTDIHTFIDSIKLILSTPDHSYQDGNVLIKILKFFGCIAFSNPFAPVVGALSIILTIVINKDKKLVDHKKNYWYCAVILTLIMTIGLLFNRYINFYAFPITILGFFSYILNKNNNTKRIFYYVWIIGIMYSFSIYFSSNQAYYAISSVSIISSMASILLVYYFIMDQTASEKELKLLSYIFISLFLVVYLGMLACRINDNFWDDSTSKLSYKITDGPGAGIVTSKNNYDEYYLYWNDTEEIREIKTGRVLYYTYRTWPQLADVKDIGCYSTQITRDPAFLFNYYVSHPDKKAENIFLGKDMKLDVIEFMKELSISGDVKEMESGYLISNITYN